MKKLPLFCLCLLQVACSVELAPPRKDPDFVPLAPAHAQSCEACTEAKCPAYAACLGSSSCLALGTCLSTCATPGCQAGCYDQYADAYDLYFQVVSCSYQSCSSECESAACTDCERVACSPEKSACVSDASCLRHWYCLSLCQDDACDTECHGYVTGTDAPAELDAYMTCSVTQCASQCSAPQ
jgi:hypothetical protein